jgi:hypothetical protein
VADVEDPLVVGVDDQVDLALAVLRLRIDHADMEVREGPEGLGEQGQRHHLDRELAPARRDHLALRPDPVAHVEVGDHQLGALVELVVLEQQLDAPGLVVEVGELELAVTPDGQEATGHGLARRCTLGQVGVRGSSAVVAVRSNR